MKVNNDLAHCLTDSERDFLLYRILSERQPFMDTFIRDPTLQDMANGKQVYFETLTYLRRRPQKLSDADVYIQIVNRGNWSGEDESTLEKLPDRLNDAKVAYYNNFFRSASNYTYKSNILNLLRKFQELNSIRYRYTNLTIEGISNTVMWEHLIKQLYDGDFPIQAINHYHSNSINDYHIRDVALSNEWGSYWNCTDNVFGVPSVKLTENKRRLVHWSKIYDSIKQHPDCPAQDLIEDHFAFDGWLIMQNRKDRAKKKQSVALGDKFAGKGNVYLVGNNKDELKDIMALNDPNGVNRIRRRFREVDSQKNVKETRFKK